MIHISKTAAEQIKQSAEQSEITHTSLRIAIKKNDDGSLHYAMGFDDAISDDDMKFTSNDIDLVISPSSIALATGMTIDFVELDDKQFNFIFINPNDPNYSPADK